MADTAFDIKSDSPVNDDLKFWSIVGHEALSRPSFYELTVLSKNQHILPKDILGKAFNVGAYFMNADNEAHERHFQGHAVRMVRGGQVGNRYFQYHISLRSWFWLLTRRTNSRIYQDKPVMEVADAVFEDSPIKRFKKTNIDNVTGKHKPRRYCVQHAESDYQFLSHLLEDEGIYYWFDGHDKPGTMYFSDSSDMAHTELPAANKLRYAKDGLGDGRFNEIVRWVSGDRLDTGHHAGSDSNFKTIRKKLGAKINAADEHDLADFEMFESPAGYFNGEDAETSAKIRGDELAARRQRYWAVTGWPDVAAGSNFTFEGDPDGLCDGDYLIAGCTFVMSHPGYEGVSSKTPSVSIMKVLHEALNDDAINVQTLDTIEYIVETTPTLRTGVRGTSTFLLTLLPAEQPYRPARLTPNVVMPGPQSAIVVGAAGKEIDVDEFGRVKVQFHWDRYGTNDDKSTAWVRVSQPMAGKGWGAYFTPRIGQEVIVDFLNGDPDRPIITGRVYNDEQPIPYKSGTQSGFKTRSSPGGTPANYNEIMFEDKKGAENINIHAERNMSKSVEVDDSTSVGHDQNISVGNYQWISVKSYRSVIVQAGNEDYVINGGRSTYVQKDDNYTVDGHRLKEIGKGEESKITGEQKLTVTGDKKSSITGLEEHTVGGKITQSSKVLDMITAEKTTISAGTKLGIFSDGDMSVATNAKLGVFSKSDLNIGSGTANIGLSAPTGSIDLMAVKVNTITTGASKQYTNAAKTTYAFGMYSKNVMAIYQENFLGLQNKNAVGVTLENKVGLNLTNVFFKFENSIAAIDKQAIKSFSTGAPAAAASSAGSAGVGMNFATAVQVLGFIAAAIGLHKNFSAMEEDERKKAEADRDAVADRENAQRALTRARDSLARLAAEARSAGRGDLADRLTTLSRIPPSHGSQVVSLGKPADVAIDDGTFVNRH
jgi:type VI secretion system secreted protein VgrG